MNEKFILAGLVGVLVYGCSNLPGTEISPLTPSELNENPVYYDGREVTVKGYVKIISEGHNIYESKQLSDEFERKWNANTKGFDPKVYRKYCLTIENPSIINSNGENFRKTMTVSGKFVAHYLHDRFIDLGACSLPTAIVIDKVVSY